MLDIDGAARKRSTCDLIDELDAEVECSILAAIAVGFETKTTFVFAADVNRLTLLNALLPKHGLPLGIVGLRDGPEGVQFYCRPFREFAAVPWVPRYLADLSEVVLAIYRGALHPALLCPRNN
jgi:hypothetical protein